MNKVNVTVVASGFPLPKKEIKETFQFWQNKGIKLSFPKVEEVSCTKDLLCASGLEYRAHELAAAMSPKNSNKFIWALRGGYGMQEILPYIKPSQIDRNKIYIGFSDCTSFHYYLNKTLEMPSVHGPHPNSFNLNSAKILNKYNMLFEKLNLKNEVFLGIKTLNKVTKEEIRGKMVGGNLTTLASILGTKYDKGSRGNLVFLEEVDEPAYKINRLLVHLQQAGFLKGARAVVFGHFTHKDKKQKKTIDRVLKRWAESLKIPVVKGFSAGHDHRTNRPFWLGKKSCLILDEKPRLINNVL